MEILLQKFVKIIIEINWSIFKHFFLVDLMSTKDLICINHAITATQSSMLISFLKTPARSRPQFLLKANNPSLIESDGSENKM